MSAEKQLLSVWCREQAAAKSGKLRRSQKKMAWLRLQQKQDSLGYHLLKSGDIVSSDCERLCRDGTWMTVGVASDICKVWDPSWLPVRRLGRRPSKRLQMEADREALEHAMADYFDKVAQMDPRELLADVLASQLPSIRVDPKVYPQEFSSPAKPEATDQDDP